VKTVLKAGSALICALLVSVGCDEESRHHDVILITVDTLRADHVSPYNRHAPTPWIDVFSQEATVFERCAAPMPLTRPSHASLFTSLYPREHGVLNNAMALPSEAVSLTEVLRWENYRTGGFVGVRLLGPDSGVGQGFEVLDQPSVGRERRAEFVVQRALAWLDDLRQDEKFFVWVHLFDPHLPYAPPDPFRSQVAADRPEIEWSHVVDIATENDGDVPASFLEDAKKLYLGEVAYVDHWIGKLLSGVDKRRSSDDTLVVLTADHGECFENGIWFEHADCLGEPGIRVPLIIRYPAGQGAGDQIPVQTSIVDIAPTVLRAAGIAIPDGLSGRPLQDHAEFEDRKVLVQYPFFQQSAAERRPARLEAVRSVAGELTTPLLLGVEKVGIVGRDWKYLRTMGELELYALTPDPDERQNRIETDSEVAEEMKEELERLLAEHRLNLIDTPEINEELLEMLEALGYI
jgi:arylsulfatase A-like enzyme